MIQARDSLRVWRGEPLCGTRQSLAEVPAAHREAGCQPEPGPEECCALGALTGASWRGKEVTLCFSKRDPSEVTFIGDRKIKCA